MRTEKCTAIVLAAGQGKRMGTKVQKQYLELAGKPILYYSLAIFESSELIDEVILVVGENQKDYCEKEIVLKYGFQKVRKIVEGGRERYHSVWNGLQEIGGEGYVFIHDGARPFISEEILQRAYQNVERYKACVVGMPVKDTIKSVNEEAFVETTPNRDTLWMVQTPQVFENNLIKEAYAKLMSEKDIQVTDDAMVAEQMLHLKPKMVRGTYENIKITTPEDLEVASVFVKKCHFSDYSGLLCN